MEQIVALFDTQTHAQEAYNRLVEIGVPQGDLRLESQTSTAYQKFMAGRSAGIGADGRAMDAGSSGLAGTGALGTGALGSGGMGSSGIGAGGSGLSGGSAGGAMAASEPRETTQHHGGFWAWLLGEESTTPERSYTGQAYGEPSYAAHSDTYQRSLESGSYLLIARCNEADAHRVIDALETFNPVDLDERAGSYGYAGTSTGNTPRTSETTSLAGDGTLTSAAGGTPALGTPNLGTERTATGAGNLGITGIGTGGTETGREQVIGLSEESLQVGKRMVDRGTTRIRRYVVESPVEQQVNLREETVSIERRRPVTDTVTGQAFTEQTIEVTTKGEVPVVSKTAHVAEEVVVTKTETDRTETVSDTVRREQIEVIDPKQTNQSNQTNQTSTTETDPATRTSTG